MTTKRVLIVTCVALAAAASFFAGMYLSARRAAAPGGVSPLPPSAQEGTVQGVSAEAVTAFSPNITVAFPDLPGISFTIKHIAKATGAVPAADGNKRCIFTSVNGEGNPPLVCHAEDTRIDGEPIAVAIIDLVAENNTEMPATHRLLRALYEPREAGGEEVPIPRLAIETPAQWESIPRRSKLSLRLTFEFPSFRNDLLLVYGAFPANEAPDAVDTLNRASGIFRLDFNEKTLTPLEG